MIGWTHLRTLARRAPGLAALLLLASHATQAQLARLVKDLAPGTQLIGSSQPEILGRFGPWLLFQADVDGLSRELWRTDGTPAGTELVREYCPGAGGSSSHLLGVLGGRAIVLQEGNCTAEEAVIAIDASGHFAETLATVSGGFSAESSVPTRTGSYLIFGAFDEEAGWRLFRTDGTAAGTASYFQPDELYASPTAAGGRIYFADSLGLWVTDGTAAGTSLIASGGYSSLSIQPSAAGPMFATWQVGSRLHLMTSDGTIAGTREVGVFPGAAQDLLRFDQEEGRAYFAVRDSSLGTELWTSDGTNSGTGPVTNFGPEEAIHLPTHFDPLSRRLALLDGRVYFLADDGISGLQLFRAGPGPQEQVALAHSPARPYLEIVEAQRFGDAVYFTGTSPAHGDEPWRTDGTAQGTRIARDHCAGSCSSQVRFGPTHDDGMLFVDGSLYDEVAPLWFADGSFDRVVKLTRDASGEPVAVPGKSEAWKLGERWIFPARDATALDSLWSMDETDLAPERVGPPASASAGSHPAQFAIAGQGSLFFTAADGSGPNAFSRAIFETAGSDATTIDSGGNADGCDNYFPFDVAGDRLVFGCDGLWSVFAGSHSPVELPSPVGTLEGTASNGSIVLLLSRLAEPSPQTAVWTTDGTPAGTLYRFDFSTDFHGTPRPYSVNGTFLLFPFQGSRYRLMRTNASYSALAQLVEFSQDAYVPESIQATSDRLFFTVCTPGACAVWCSDGTPAGTGPVEALGGLEQPSISGAQRFGDGYRLTVIDGSASQVWDLDADAESGHLVFASETGLYFRGPIETVGSTSFFLADRNSTGLELWSTGGTAETTRFRAVVKPPGSSEDEPPVFAAMGGAIYFSGWDPLVGRELRRISEEGEPRLMHDLFPGPNWSTPYALTPVGSSVYFVADDGIHGRELWVVEPDGPACTQDARYLCLQGGRFQVYADWRDFAGTTGIATAAPIVADTGSFWFFDEENVEVLVKVINGQGTNGHHWVFYGALTNVEYAFTVTDAETGAAKRYYNPVGRFASSGDIYALGQQGESAKGGAAIQETGAGLPPAQVGLFSSAGATGSCVPTATRFCILGNRFGIEATWRDFVGNTGVANAGTLTGDTGYLWFFDEANVEIVVKAVDGSSYNDHFWIYYGALSNVEYTITVTDTVAGTIRTYRNPLGAFGSFGDIEAFPAD